MHAIETPRIAFAPSFARDLVRSIERRTFVWSSIKVNQKFVNSFLVFDINATLDQFRCNDIINVRNGFRDTFDKLLVQSIR